jgi:hypothetical protein
MHYKMFAALRYTSRTILHYPEVWWHCMDAIHRGMTAGWASEPLFMQKLEPVLGLPLAEARKALGVRAAVDRDTGQASAFWLGEGPPPPRFDEDRPSPRGGVTGGQTASTSARMPPDKSTRGDWG